MNKITKIYAQYHGIDTKGSEKVQTGMRSNKELLHHDDSPDYDVHDRGGLIFTEEQIIELMDLAQREVILSYHGLTPSTALEMLEALRELESDYRHKYEPPAWKRQKVGELVSKVEKEMNK